MEVPIAVPLRVPPTGSTSHAQPPSKNLNSTAELEDEMDIGAAIPASAPALNSDLLVDTLSPRSELPSTVRLGATGNRSKSSPLVNRGVDGAASDDDADDIGASSIKSDSNTLTARNGTHHAQRPRMNYPGAGGGGRSRSSWDWAGHGRRRSGSSRRRSSFGGLWLSDDEAEGDLGYSALTAGDAAKKKVIAERLEPVKARNPVFTWC